MIAFASGMLLVAITGAALVRLVAPRLRGAAFAGAVVLVGSGACSLALLVLSAAGIRWGTAAVIAACAVVAAASVPFLRRRRGPAPAPERFPYGAAAAVMDLGALVVVAAHARFALLQPLYEWDYFGIWGLKGRTFFDAGAVDWAFVRTNISHPDYPLLVPLAFDFFSAIRGAWDETAIALWCVAICVGLLLVVRGLVAAEFRSHAIGAVVALVAASPAMNVWIGLAEGAVMAYGCAGLLLLRHGLRDGEPQAVRLGAVMLALAAWSKNEGLALIAIAAVAAFAWRWRPRDLLALWPAVALIAPWLAVRRFLGLATDFMGGDVLARVTGRLSRPHEVALAYAASPPDQLLLWALVVIVLLLYAREGFRPERMLYVALLGQTALLVLQALATRVDFRAHVSLTMNRIPQQVLPAAVVLAAVLVVAASRRSAPERPPEFPAGQPERLPLS